MIRRLFGVKLEDLELLLWRARHSETLIKAAVFGRALPGLLSRGGDGVEPFNSI